MSKGQKRSNREIKKPKKTTAEKVKDAAVKLSSQPSGISYKDRFKRAVTPNS
jgi:ribosomal protein S12